MSLPPLHPILVNFTAALIPVSVFSDFLGAILKRDSFRAVGWWSLLYVTVVTPFTVLAGWLWLPAVGSGGQTMMVHKWLGTGLAAILVPLVIWRGLMWRRQHRPGIAYLAVAAVLVISVVVQGHLGGSLTFGDADEKPPAVTGHVNPATRSANPHDLGGGWRDEIEVK